MAEFLYTLDIPADMESLEEVAREHDAALHNAIEKYERRSGELWSFVLPGQSATFQDFTSLGHMCFDASCCLCGDGGGESPSQWFTGDDLWLDFR